MLMTKLSRRWRTTVPAAVREALDLTPGDHLVWEIQGDEAIVRHAGTMAATEGDDPALEPFLRLLANDIEAHPERLREMPEELYRRWMAVTADVEVDLDEALDGAVGL